MSVRPFREGFALVADSAAHVIVQVGLEDGRAFVLAGCGRPGYAGHGGLGSNALVCHPADAVWDGGDRAFIADAANSCIRSCSLASNLMSTIAGKHLQVGSCLQTPCRLAMAADGCSLFVLDRGSAIHVPHDGLCCPEVGRNWEVSQSEWRELLQDVRASQGLQCSPHICHSILTLQICI
jgi:hypothetical protein